MASPWTGVLGHTTAAICGSASVPAISGGFAWVALYAKHSVLVVLYVNFILVVIYDFFFFF